MVYLKVSDGSETRKLQLTPGEVSFDQLRERLATLFPRTLGEGSGGGGLSLQYRDTDGDVITLSSDQELQLALSQLEDDGVWKVYINNTRQHAAGGSSSGAQQKAQSTCQKQPRQRSPCHGGSLFQHLFEPSVRRHGLFSDAWGDLELQLQLLHDLHNEIFSSSGGGKTDQHSTTELSDTSEESSNPETAKETLPKTTEQQTVTLDTDEEVKSKPQAAAATSERKEEGHDTGAKSVDNSLWQTRRFVTWEPQLHVGPFGFCHSRLVPVVYNVSFRTSSPSIGSGCCSAKKRDETLGRDAPSVVAESKEAEKQSPAADTSAEATALHSESSKVSAQ